MRLKDQFQFIRQNIKKNKVRMFMTVLATAMGVAFLIVLASIGFGLQQSIVKETMEQRVVTKIDVHGKETDDGSYRSLTAEDIKAFETLDEVKAVTRRIQLAQTPSYAIEGYEADAPPTLVAHFPSETAAGLELSDGRLPQTSDEVIVGHDFSQYLVPDSPAEEELYNEQGEMKEKYRYQETLIGKTLEMTVQKEVEGEQSFHTVVLEIVGVTEKPTREWMQDLNVYISQDTLRGIEAFTGTPKGAVLAEEERMDSPDSSNSFDQVNVYADNLEAVKGIAEKLQNADYAIYSVVNEMEEINTFFTIAKAGLILIGTIAILIASIGIYNTMTMAVTERAPDIGIMKAVGANPKTIKQIFLLESSYIGLIGAIIGTVAAYIISLLVNFGLPVIIEAAFDETLPEGLRFSFIPWSLVAISVTICLVVTILSGMRPAKRATEIDVLKAMRREA